METQYVENVALNKSNKDVRVNFLQQYEFEGDERSRWRVENETFNTLKNQGYNLEHNYGHSWESIRIHLRHFDFESIADLYTAIAASTLTKSPPVR